MLQILIFTLLILFNGYSLESKKDNLLSFNELMEKFICIDKTIYFLPDNDFIILYTYQKKVIGVSRMSKDKSKEFHLCLPKQLIVEDLPKSSHYDFYQIEKSMDEDRSYIQKAIGKIFKEEYIFDQNSRLIKYLSEDQNIFFLNKKGYSRLNFEGNLNFSELIIRTEGVIGTLSSFIVKDLERNIVLAVVDNIPYLPVVDKEGSIIKLLNFSLEEVASTTFSKNGNIVKYSGLINAPFCFRGMYREKISGIYLDENSCFDADFGSFLDFNDFSLTEFSQEVES